MSHAHFAQMPQAYFAYMPHSHISYPMSPIYVTSFSCDTPMSPTPCLLIYFTSPFFEF